MPIYEYVCEACGRLCEFFQKATDPQPRQQRPECGERKLALPVSRTTFRLKGPGWHSDLYSTPRSRVRR